MDTVRFDTITQYGQRLGFRPQHPLIAVFDLADMPPDTIGRKRFGFYCVLLKEHYNGKISYGRGMYHYQGDTLIFTSPGQVIGIDMEDVANRSKGMFMMIHPDYLIGTSLAQHINDYFFFAYDVNEALQMSPDEKERIVCLFDSIKEELTTPADRHSRSIVTSYLETMLSYCLRFYDRQFSERKTDGTNIISRLEMVLEQYYTTNEAAAGLPSVAYCAGRLNLSPNYFGDLVKRETGKSARDYIHSFIIAKAKLHLAATSMTIREVAYHLGFRYPHHFSRLFKRHTTLTPNEYKQALLKN